MGLLTDEEIIAAIAIQPPAIPLIEGLALPSGTADRYSKDSPVQASSVDLHIGDIYLPGEKEADVGGTQKPKDNHSLMTGETAVVTTVEKLHLPSDVAGFGFPPSRVSFRGLLMTNPGHVDPGYDGIMRFTVINMAREPYSLERGETIVTLLLFRLDNPVHANWHQRNPGGSSLPNEATINRLSRDFVDVKNRAEEIATKRGIQWTVGITVAVTLIVGVLQVASSGRFLSRADVEELKKRQDIVEYDVKNRVDVDKKLQDFDSRLQQVQREVSELEAQRSSSKAGIRASGSR